MDPLCTMTLLGLKILPRILNKALVDTTINLIGQFFDYHNLLIFTTSLELTTSPGLLRQHFNDGIYGQKGW